MSNPLQIPGSDFGNIGPMKRRILWSAEGQEKEGKTHLALTMPGPIAVLNLDSGLEGVVEKFAGKQITVCNIPLPTPVGNKSDIQSQAQDTQAKFLKNYQMALESPDIRSIIVDTGSELWDIYQLALFGKLAQNNKFFYGAINAAFTEVLRRPMEYTKNVCFIHKTKPVYIGDSKTGEFERAGFKNAGYVMQSLVRCYRDTNDKSFHAEVLNSRHNPDLMGMDFEGDMNTFAVMASLMVSDTTPDDWE